MLFELLRVVGVHVTDCLDGTGSFRIQMGKIIRDGVVIIRFVGHKSLLVVGLVETPCERRRSVPDGPPGEETRRGVQSMPAIGFWMVRPVDLLWSSKAGPGLIASQYICGSKLRFYSDDPSQDSLLTCARRGGPRPAAVEHDRLGEGVNGVSSPEDGGTVLTPAVAAGWLGGDGLVGGWAATARSRRHNGSASRNRVDLIE